MNRRDLGVTLAAFGATIRILTDPDPVTYHDLGMVLAVLGATLFIMDNVWEMLDLYFQDRIDRKENEK